MSKLTYKQNLFIQYYKGNATDAARQAGYKGSQNVLGKTGHDLLKIPKIIQAIQARDSEDPEQKEAIISRKEMEEELTKMVRSESPYGDIKTNDRIKALERLAKMRGYDKESLEITGTIEHLSDRQLEARFIHFLTMLGVSKPVIPLLPCDTSGSDPGGAD